MPSWLGNTAFWTALGVVLAAVGIEVPEAQAQHILEALAIISGLIALMEVFVRGGPPP